MTYTCVFYFIGIELKCEIIFSAGSKISVVLCPAMYTHAQADIKSSASKFTGMSTKKQLNSWKILSDTE